jgi:hypothetical protein
MPDPKYTYEQLLEKNIRAKIHLEGHKMIPHKMTCASEDLTGHPCPCNCGADAANRPIEQALAALKL